MLSYETITAKQNMFNVLFLTWTSKEKKKPKQQSKIAYQYVLLIN